MEEHNKNIDLFDDYLSGKMSDAEKNAFELRLKQDPELKAAFELHQVLVDGIKEAGRAEVKKLLKKEGAVKYFGNLWGQKWTIASAAIFLMFFAMYLVIDKLPSTFNREKFDKTEAISKDGSEDSRGEKASKRVEKTESISPQDSIIETKVDDIDSTKVEEIDVQILSEEELIPEEAMEEDDDLDIRDAPKPETLAGNDAKRSQSVDKSATSPPQTEKKKEQIESIFKSTEIPGEPEITVASSSKLSDTFLMIPILTSDTSAIHDNINVKITYMKSPLNSQIFKYTISPGHVIEVYGIPNKSLIPLGKINQDIYLKSGKNIYRFRPVPEYVPLEIEKRKEIIKLLEKK
jgi:hypothetical protein